MSKQENQEKIQLLETKIEQLTQELKTKDKQLEENQKLLEQQEKLAFLGKNGAYISHEIRNPIGCIELANLISKQLINNLSQQEHSSQEQSTFTQLLDNFHKTEEAIERINQVIVLLNDHIKADERPALMCNLNEVIDEALDITTYSFGIRHNWTGGIEIKTDYAPDLPEIQLYRSDFERALCNLIDNSLYSLMQKQTVNPDFLPRLLLVVKQLDKRIQIILEDNGEGIKAQDETRVFEEFYTTKKNKGTGLGLFIVKQIIEDKHDGELNLETSFGEFARIIITIPSINEA